MKNVVVCSGVLLALIGGGVAYSAASPGAKLQKQDRLYGGGHFAYGTGRNFAVDAHADGGGVGAVGNSTYGGTGGLLQQYRSVTCLGVDGDRAVIGGVVQSGSDVGYWYVQYFVDRGGPAAAAGTRDLASASYEDPANSPSWPTGFPYTCPSPTLGFPGAEPAYVEVDAGDIVVADAPSD